MKRKHEIFLTLLFDKGTEPRFVKRALQEALEKAIQSGMTAGDARAVMAELFDGRSKVSGEVSKALPQIMRDREHAAFIAGWFTNAGAVSESEQEAYDYMHACALADWHDYTKERVGYTLERKREAVGRSVQPSLMPEDQADADAETLRRYSEDLGHSDFLMGDDPDELAAEARITRERIKDDAEWLKAYEAFARTQARAAAAQASEGGDDD